MAEESCNRIAEGTGFKPLEDPRLCTNNCGFFGSPANQNLCSKCYRDLEQSAKPPVEKTQSQSLNTINPNSRMDDLCFGSEDVEITRQSDLPSSSSSSGSAGALPETYNRNRCLSCKKRLGLTGFTCRCGSTFCSVHRYPERHECGFDFKAAGREAIAKANPVIKIDKVERI